MAAGELIAARPSRLRPALAAAVACCGIACALGCEDLPDEPLTGWRAFCAAMNGYHERCSDVGLYVGNPCDVTGQQCLEKAHRAEMPVLARDCPYLRNCNLEECVQSTKVPQPTAAAVDWDATCHARIKECAAPWGYIGPDPCYDYASVSDDYIEAHRHCLALDCDEIAGCLYPRQGDFYCGSRS